jgi:plastocyanin
MTQGRTPFSLGELVGPALIAFLAAGVVLTFFVAFALSGDGGGETVTEGTSEPTPAATPSEGEVTIAMVPVIKFDSDTLTIAGGEPVEVLADNQDTGIPHNFAVYESQEAFRSGGFDAALAATEICNGLCQDTLTLELEAGEYFFQCDVHATQMTGMLVVQ